MLKLENKFTGEVVKGTRNYERTHYIINGNQEPTENYRKLLDGDVPMWSLVSVKHCVTGKTRLAGITGTQAWSPGYTVSYMGSDGCIHHDEIEAILDRDFYLDSPIWQVASFYRTWKEKKQLVCTKCKKEFHYEGWDCSRCERGITLSDKMFAHIELTDEMVKKHNAEVIFKNFKRWFEGNSGYHQIRDGAEKVTGWISSDFPESMMEKGAEIKKYYDLLNEDQIHQLRECFKICYSVAVNTLNERRLAAK